MASATATLAVNAMVVTPAAGENRRHKPSIADAPDQGTLLGYSQNVPTRQQGALSWHPAAISEAHALASIAKGEMHLAAPDGGQVRLRYLRHTEQLGGNWTWVGQVVGGDARQNAVITFGPQAVFGSIPRGSQPALQLQTRQGIVYVVAADPSRLLPFRSNDDARLPPPAGGATSAALGKREAKAAAPPRTAITATASESTTVDVVVGYSNGMQAELGSESAVVTRMAYLVEYGNQAMVNSQVTGGMRLVGTAQVTYSDTTTNDSTLDDVTGRTLAALTPLHQARDAYGADILLLARPLRAEHEGCGIAWLLGGGQTPITPSDANWAYGVISDGSYSEGNTTWFCGDSTLAHEAGHLLGSVHDRANASGTGRYPYSYGYNASGVCDVMAYCDEQNVEYQVFSNPRISICGGNACGVLDSEDNARSLNQTISLVAAFRATVVPHAPASTPRNDFDGDGRSDLFWRNLVDGRDILWWGAEYADQRDVGGVATLTWNVVGAGDFDGDGSSDLFWRNASSGQNIVWPSADNTRLRYTTAVTNPAWKVVGIGDFNGDERDDIFWRNTSSGENIIWWSGEYVGLTREQTVSTAWQVVGIGDFDGDGESDVFWRNALTGANIVWWSGDYAGFASLNPVANAAWEVVASDDFDGDGRADVFWRNRNTGENIIWWQADYAQLQQEVAINTAWKVEASGDYDGDGEADLFWRHSTTGQNVVWDSGRYANRRDLTGVTNMAWAVQP
ncbi:reprolysin-like metallopeptidase [Thermomonas carbonis]|uniref:VCBS repeat-containing protein n=1 Tax=Thermomonas carbonis TaxID=1463158 RepID=A0A7G9SU87_9GAMM|nr:FG-GAP-like repeat-containing protein [Thermomonas carbonis]QNN71412.1 VCBS repeat-containing protein [Thermomonas carbonis]